MRRRIIKSREESLYGDKFKEILDDEAGLDNYRIIGYCSLDFSEEKIGMKFQDRVSVEGVKTCVISVFGREGKFVPHFHIISVDKDFLCAIKLDKPEYFIHTKYKDKLPNRKSREFIDEYLRKPYKKEEKTIWDKMINDWDEIHETDYTSKLKDQPDYKKLK